MRRVYCVWVGRVLLAAVVTALSFAQPQASELDHSSSQLFTVDASWPKPLPAPVDANGIAHPWVTGEVGGTCIDKHDNVYTFNRGWEVGVTLNGTLQGNLGGAIVAQDASASAIPSPPVVAYDSSGKVIAGWGNPALVQTGADYGYAAYMAQSAHGCFVDYQGFIWFAGSGDGIVQKYNPAAAQSAGTNATFLLQIGVKGHCDTASPPAAGANPYTSCNESTDANTSHTMLNEPADITVDPTTGPVSGKVGDVYIADGYGNHRIVVFNAQGNYVGQWGTTCKISNTATNSQNCPPGTFGATGGGHPHCVVLGNDGFVYVCDRPNSRIQVFSRKCAVPSTSSNPEPVCQPTRIININGFGKASDGEEAAILLAGTRATDIDFWPNIDYLASRSPTRQDLMLDVDLGNDNVWVMDKLTGLVVGALGVCGIAPCPGHNAGHFAFGHMLASDSQGNVYVSETVTGRRTQKFVPGNQGPFGHY